MNANDLIQFENRILAKFEDGQIKAPIHLSSNNEAPLIKIFDDYQIGDDDWVMCTWRSHYECLLKGVAEEELERAILNKRSISLCFAKYNILSSAIVGGICPVALGVAQGLRLNNKKGRVFCFVGDMSCETGIFHECHKYGINHDLPIYWVIGDNNKSVCTDTRNVWGFDNWEDDDSIATGPRIIRYYYASKYPHAGGLSRVNF